MPKTINLKQIIVIALFAIALAIPLVVHASAEENKQPVENEETVEIVEAEIEEVVEETPEPVLEETPEEVVEETEESVPNEEEEVVTELSLADALTIAQTEHPDSEVLMAKVKLKKLEGEKVYKFVFADGWRLYVRASDGEIVRIKDGSNKEHDCSKRGQSAVLSWRSRKHSSMKNFHGRSHQHRKDKWHRDYRDKTPVTEEGGEETAEL